MAANMALRRAGIGARGGGAESSVLRRVCSVWRGRRKKKTRAAA